MCPNCKNTDFKPDVNKLTCGTCNAEYSYKGGNFYFVAYSQNDIFDFIDKIKYKLKKIREIIRFSYTNF